MSLPALAKDASERPEKRVVGRKIMGIDLRGTAFGCLRLAPAHTQQPFLRRIRQGAEACETKAIKPGGQLSCNGRKPEEAARRAAQAYL